MAFHLKHILKALLLSTSEPLSVKDIQAVITRYHQQNTEKEEKPDSLESSSDHSVAEGNDTDNDENQSVLEDVIDQVPAMLSSSQITDAMDELAQELIENRDVWRIISGSQGYRITNSPEYALWVRLLRNEPKPLKLSQAALETLAIIAYRQPVTRAEVETIRGVSIDGALHRLLELEFVVNTGRADLPGKPLQYGTTPKFLDFCGVRSVEELPASDVLSPQQINEWVRRATTMELNFGDKEMGLPSEEEHAGNTSEDNDSSKEFFPSDSNEDVIENNSDTHN